MASSNTTFGVQNISESSNVSTSAWNLSEFSGRVGDTFASQAAGSVELGGLLALSMIGFMLFRSDVSEEVSASVMIPTVFFMASQGYLPYGQGIIYAMLLVIAGVFIFGVIKYADR